MASGLKYTLYENDEVLKKCLCKILTSLRKSNTDIIIINISYCFDKNKIELYSGVKYIIEMRGERKITTPVVFYGFEKYENIKNKPALTIFDSPAVTYIQVPFLIAKLKSAINSVSYKELSKKTLDEKTARSLALERISGIKHDLINATILLNQHIHGLSALDEVRRRGKWSTLQQFSDDFIEKRSNRYTIVKDVIEKSFLKSNELSQIPILLENAEDMYSKMKLTMDVSGYSEGILPEVIKTGDELVLKLKKVQMILEDIQHAAQL